MTPQDSSPPVPPAVRVPAGAPRRGPEVDYPDELVPGRTLHDDAISTAVGSSFYIIRAGAQALPWLRWPETAADRLLARRPLLVDRYYPTLRLLIDIVPQAARRDAERRREIAVKRRLCYAHGHAYVPLGEGDAIDARLFADARRSTDAPAAPDEPAVALEDLGVGVVADAVVDRGVAVVTERQVLRTAGVLRDAAAESDDVSLLLGETTFFADAGTAVVPWAHATPAGLGDWAREDYVFDRYYRSAQAAVDFYPRLDALDPVHRRRLEDRIALRRSVCHAHGAMYLAVESEVPLTTSLLDDERNVLAALGAPSGRPRALEVRDGEHHDAAGAEPDDHGDVRDAPAGHAGEVRHGDGRPVGRPARSKPARAAAPDSGA